MIRLMYGLAAWLAGSAIAYVLASIAHTQCVLAGLASLGVDIGIEERLDTTLGDLAGLTVYAFVIAVALAGGLLVLSTPPFRPLPLWVRGAIAGGTGIGVALFAMKSLAGFTPIAGAREPTGFVLQCLAGAIGGVVAALGWAVLRTQIGQRRSDSAVTLVQLMNNGSTDNVGSSLRTPERAASAPSRSNPRRADACTGEPRVT